MLKIKGRVVEILLDKYIVQIEKEEYVEAFLKGNLKRKGAIIVGDFVWLEYMYDKYMIVNVAERKNSLIRPPVANIEKLVIVMALTNPQPDFMLLDKELILCNLKNITPVLIVNKIDLLKEDSNLKNTLEYINETYKELVEKIIYFSVPENKGKEELVKVLKDSTAAFSGNSGVGKSSITSLLLDGKKYENLKEIEIGNLGKKTAKGKHTTKYVKLYSLEENTYLLDTPGFSSYELYDVNYKDLKRCYDDFRKFSCDFEDCNHVNEETNVCGIKKAVKDGIIDKGRYERYVSIFKKLKELDDKKYK